MNKEKTTEKAKHEKEIIKTEKEKFNPKFHEAVEIEKVKKKFQDQMILTSLSCTYLLCIKATCPAKVMSNAL